MKLLETLREKLAKKFILEHAGKIKRTPKPAGLSNASGIVLLYYLPDEDTYKKAEAIIAGLNEQGYKVRVICYSDLKVFPHYFIPKLQQDIFTYKNLNWKMQPDKPFIKEFLDTPFDILIDLSLEEHLPLIYCAALSKAGLKVGRYEDGNEKVYDLMIQTVQGDDIQGFFEKVLFYLNKINI